MVTNAAVPLSYLLNPYGSLEIDSVVKVQKEGLAEFRRAHAVVLQRAMLLDV
jgi:hypothetical protein